MSRVEPEAALEAAVARTPASRLVEPSRAVRFLEFAAVGATGVLVDLTITLSLLGRTHYLLANLAGFLVAVSWNFAGNWLVTFDRPDGVLRWQYLSYVGLHSLTFGLRAAAIVLIVEAVGVPAAVATGVGVAVAAIANFLGSEVIFEGVGERWLNAVEAFDQLAHRVYSSRIRTWLRRSGLYTLAYGGYVRLMGACYRDRTRTVESGAATATLAMHRGPLVVSVLHTLAKERPIIDRFVADLEPDDVVWDVGANVGVYACLAGDIADRVVAFEPYAPTAEILRGNLLGNGIDGHVLSIALGAEYDQVGLDLERSEVGTQTPTVGPRKDESQPVVQKPGDAIARIESTPTVVKIDVEGAEAAVLEGMTETLQQCRLVYCESHGAGDVRAQLERLGFDVEIMDDASETYLRGVRR
jgi:FkbM family methyltransferase